METIIKQSKVKNSKSMRYEAEWLLECMLLRIKSPSVYEHLRKTKLVPLPHKDTLRRLIGGMSCHFGFNQMAFDAMKRSMEDKPDSERSVVLSFDELAIQAGLQFNCESLAFDGFTKHDDDPIINRESIEMAEEKSSYDGSSNSPMPIVKKDISTSSLADHGLVFMLRTINSTKSNWIQPCGVFGSRSSTPGEDLFRLVLSCIIRCEVFGVRVIAVVSDGAQSNKTVWNKCGIGIKSYIGEIEENLGNSETTTTSSSTFYWENESMENILIDMDFQKEYVEVQSRSGNSSTNDVNSVNDASNIPTKEVIMNWMAHPMVPDAKIYFLQDPPHIFKCIRNQMFNHKTVQV